MKTLNFITVILYMIAAMFERMESLKTTTFKIVVEYFDAYVSPIYTAPFIEGAIKPPTLTY